MANYQVMPDLTAQEYEDLKNDIAQNGVVVPVVIDEFGNVIDGVNRVNICEELGIDDFPTSVQEGLDEDEKYMMALNLNVKRRHLSSDQLHEVIQGFREKHPGVSDRQIAKAVGVSHTTVWSHKNEFATGKSGQLQKTTGADGKDRPTSEEQAEQQRQEIRETIQKNPEMNNHQIAQDLKVSDHTVAKQRKEMAKDSVQESQEQQSDAEEETWAAPHEMTPAEDLKMALEDHVDGLNGVLHDLLDDYEYEDDKKEMLFSPEGIEIALEGLSNLRKVIDKYEELVKSREQ